MSYRQLEEIRDRKGEKMAAFLTMENIGGIIGGAVLMLVIGMTLPTLVRWGLTGIGAIIGLVVTFDHQGFPLYVRLRWIIAGLVRLRLTGGRWSPETLEGTKAVGQRDRAMRVGGPIKVVRRDRRSMRR
jgi:hypothetical protein